MNSTLSKVLIFTFGAAIGSAVTYKVLRTKYDQITQQEIDEMREYYERKYAVLNDTKDEPVEEGTVDNEEYSEEQPKPTERETMWADYTTELIKQGYISQDENEERGGSMTDTQIKIISPKEFDESEYEAESLTYFSDGIVVDDWGEIIEDVDNIIGTEFQNCFGEYEADTVYVRNNRLKIDYEVLRDVRTYPDSKGIDLYRVD